MERLCSHVDPETNYACGAPATRHPSLGPLGGGRRRWLCDEHADDYLIHVEDVAALANTLLEEIARRARLRPLVENLIAALASDTLESVGFHIARPDDGALGLLNVEMNGSSPQVRVRYGIDHLPEEAPPSLFINTREVLISLLSQELCVPTDDASQRGMVWATLKELGVPAADAAKALGRAERTLRPRAKVKRHKTPKTLAASPQDECKTNRAQIDIRGTPSPRKDVYDARRLDPDQHQHPAAARRAGQGPH